MASIGRQGYTQKFREARTLGLTACNMQDNTGTITTVVNG
jgi:hypothetical protein